MSRAWSHRKVQTQQACHWDTGLQAYEDKKSNTKVKRTNPIRFEAVTAMVTTIPGPLEPDWSGNCKTNIFKGNPY